ncbi:vitellogenin-like [Centruroides vittatus]|uniref:vitellogenin-like n=1 Tax=Centruroides vittatus TaxID=120091 RepID=UPI00350FDA7F
MSAKVEIIKMDDCDMILKIHETRLLANDISKAKLRELTRHDLPFSFEDGKISEICPAPEEKRNVLNIKRAILSAFQNSMKNFDDSDESVLENDIIGSCWASYSIMEKEKNKIIVRKFKNPGNCETISNGNTVSLTTLDSFSGAETAIIEQMYECEQTIEGKILTKSACNESSVFTISTEKDSQFKSNAKIELRLTDISQKPRTPSYRIHRREHLLYAHQPHTFSNSAYKESLQILHDMCSKILSRNKVDPEIPGLYASLVRSLRKVKSEELEKIYNKLDNGEICSSDWLKRLADDILPHIGHEGSVKIMARKIQSETVNKIQAALWATSLAFIKHPTEEAISAVVPLLDYKKAGTQALLGITAMCNNYCMKNTNCEHSKAIQDVITSLNRYLRYRCNVYQPTEIKQVIAALKSFGNLGRNGAAWRQILECSSQKSNVVTIRLAAIEAFRRTPCKEEVNQKLLDMFSRRDEQVEIRIAAYLGVMRCADKELVRRIQQIYDSERLNQIKTFVYSHITNLQESSSPEKEDIRRIVREFRFQPQQLDIRKYSQNIELSNYIQRMYLGGEFDSNIIYSKKFSRASIFHGKFHFVRSWKIH